MKKRIMVTAAVLGLLTNSPPVLAQQTDPTLTAAVVAQTTELKNIHKKRRNLQ